MAHDLQQLLVAPDIILARRDIEIPHQDRLFRPVSMKPVPHLGQVIELLPKFLIHFTVRLVPPCRDIKVVDRHPVFQPPSHMAGMAQPGKILISHILDRQLGQDRNTVISLLTARDHVVVSQCGEPFRRDLVHRALALLKAQNVRRLFLQQFQDDRLTQPHRIDIPSCQ